MSSFLASCCWLEILDCWKRKLLDKSWSGICCSAVGDSRLPNRCLLNAHIPVTAPTGPGRRNLHAQVPARMCREARGFGCKDSRSPRQGEVQLPCLCNTVYFIVILGGMAALLPKLLVISHSKTLAFVYHNM